jgi:ubiquinone/menaquinone biosynthesis C-methylase UbiE
MAIQIDPEEFERHSLLEYVGDLASKHVLEVGAGEGRLTWRYAEQAAHVTALDPNADRIATARQDLPKSLQSRVTLLPIGLEAFELPPGSPGFDVAIMSWSL